MLSAIRQWLWDFYLISYILVCLLQTFSFFYQGGQDYDYSLILLSFEPKLIFAYAIEVVNLIWQCLLIIPIYLYISRIRLFSQNVWRAAFFSRYSFHIFSSLKGFSYNYHTILAIIQNDRAFGVLTIFLFYGIHLPAYYALLRYAFHKNYGIPG